jgi:hypothetical protein
MIRKLLRYASYLLAGLILVSVIGILVTQRISDGPLEFLQGGPFKTGERVEAPVRDWSFGAGKNVEFELVGFGTTRTAGYIMHEGNAYMTRDLGFMWNRFEGQRRLILNLIYVFKHWHEDAVEDGRTISGFSGWILEPDPKLVQGAGGFSSATRG